MKQKILCVCMTLLMLCVGINVKADIASGTCGMNLTWVLSDDGTLTISGTGAMLNYTSSSQPWGIYRSAIVSAKINMGVTSIGNYAFRECSALTTVTLPTSLTSIGYDAFSNCLSLKSVNIPSNVKSIESWTFYQCSSLKSITIPNSVTSIGDYAFCGCTGLTSILIPNSVTSIEKYAFLDCYSLKSVSIPQSVTSIGKGVFAGCYNITSLIVDKNNKIYDSRINCNAIILTSINRLVAGCENTVIPNSVTSIEDHAFSGCSRLASITIPNSVTSIGERAFSDCSGLKSVYIGNSVMSIGDYAVYGCKLLYDIYIYIANPSPISIKSETFYDSQRNLHVVSGAKNAYQMSAYWSRFNIIEDNVILTKITLNEKSVSMGIGETKTLTAIVAPEDAVNKNVFWSSSNEDVASVNTNGVVTVKTVGSATITATAADGSGVKDTCFVFVPAATVPITDIIFNSTSVSLKVGEIKDLIANVSPTDATYKNLIWSSSNPSSAWVSSDGKVVGIATGSATITAAAADGSGVKAACKITISGKYEDVITAAIDGTNLIWLLSNDSVLTIMGNGEIPNWDNTANIPWYSNRSKILQVNINEGVTSIGKGAFYKCPNLSSIILPNNLTRIGALSFYQCTALKSISIPNSVTSIGRSAFRECSGLTSVIIPNSVTSIGELSFYQCTALKSISIPNSVTSIGSSAFRECSGLTSVIIHNSVTSIGSYAFYNCSGLTTITIPNSVTSIGSYAFDGCTGLTTITCEALVPPTILSSTFNSSTYTNATLKVYESSLDAYKNANSWKKFTKIEAIPDIKRGDVTGDGVINVGDLTALITMVMDSYADKDDKFAAADMNGDGVLNVGDITSLVTMIMSASAKAQDAADEIEAADANTLYVPAISNAKANSTDAIMSVEMVNADPISAFQFDLETPAGISVAVEDDFLAVELSTARTTAKKHVVESQAQKDGSVRVLLYSNKNYDFSGNTGEVCTIGLAIGAVADGIYDCTLKNIALSTATSEVFTPADVKAQIGVGMPVGVNNLKTMTTKMYYNLEGKQLSQPQKGINVVRYPDGTTKKVYVK